MVYNIGMEENTKKKKFSLKNIKITKKTLLIILLSLLCVIFLVVTVALSLFPKGTDDVQEVIDNSPPQQIKDVDKLEDKDFEEIFKENKEKAYKSEDYKCQIIFESGIINQPVVQGDDNYEYLRRDFETYESRVDGPVFIDADYKFGEDSNLVMYGHNMPVSMDPKQEQLFTPLHLLEKEENYNDNKKILLIFEDHQEEYQVCFVYTVSVYVEADIQYLNDGEPLYYLSNYSEEEFNTYLEAVNKKEFYDTGVKVKNTDKLITLQTCYEDKYDKLIVVAKLVKSVDFKDN